MEAKDYFVNTLKDLILINNLSIKSFSEAIGINRRSITWWFHSRSPKLESLIKIADFFNCSIDYLVGKTDDIHFHPQSHISDFFTRYSTLKTKNQLTDYRIAKLCNIRTSTIAKWKDGVIPEFEILIKLTDIFDCSLDYLAGSGR